MSPQLVNTWSIDALLVEIQVHLQSLMTGLLPEETLEVTIKGGIPPNTLWNTLHVCEMTRTASLAPLRSKLLEVLLPKVSVGQYRVQFSTQLKSPQNTYKKVEFLTVTLRQRLSQPMEGDEVLWGCLRDRLLDPFMQLFVGDYSEAEVKARVVHIGLCVLRRDLESDPEDD